MVTQEQFLTLELKLQSQNELILELRERIEDVNQSLLNLFPSLKNEIRAELNRLDEKIESNLRGAKTAINIIGDQLDKKFRWE